MKGVIRAALAVAALLMASPAWAGYTTSGYGYSYAEIADGVAQSVSVSAYPYGYWNEVSADLDGPYGSTSDYDSGYYWAEVDLELTVGLGSGYYTVNADHIVYAGEGYLEEWSYDSAYYDAGGSCSGNTQINGIIGIPGSILYDGYLELYGNFSNVTGVSITWADASIIYSSATQINVQFANASNGEQPVALIACGQAGNPVTVTIPACSDNVTTETSAVDHVSTDASVYGVDFTMTLTPYPSWVSLDGRSVREGLFDLYDECWAAGNQAGINASYPTLGTPHTWTVTGTTYGLDGVERGPRALVNLYQGLMSGSSSSCSMAQVSQQMTINACGLGGFVNYGIPKILDFVIDGTGAIASRGAAWDRAK